MSTFAIATIAFACMGGAGLLGLALHPNEKYASESSREAVRFMQGTIASIAALVLGLLVASATDHYRSQGQQVRQLGAQILTLDRMLSHYGPEAVAPRIALRRSVTFAVEEMWAERGRRMTLPPGPTLFDEVAELHPETPRQHFIQARAFEQVLAIASARAAMSTAEYDSAVQTPMLIVLVVWFMFLFFAMGIFASLNALSALATGLGSAAVASALFLVLSLDRPFEGMLAISDQPLRQSLEALHGP